MFLFVSSFIFGADAKFSIEKGGDARKSVAIIEANDSLNQFRGDSFYSILLADMKISGHFIPSKKKLSGDFHSSVIPADLKSYQYILKYKVTNESGLSLYVALYNSSNGNVVFKKSYSMNVASKYPFLAHKAISDINDALNLETIEWINRYVIFSRYTAPRKSEIVLADYTLNYQKTIIQGGLNLFPKWGDKDQQSFYYTSFSGKLPTLYRLNIYTGKKDMIATSPGMLVCSDVSKNSEKILATMAPEGQPDIYEINVMNGAKKRITDFGGIDVGGRYVDDESRVVFVSNRLGYANIFKQSLSGSSVVPLISRGKNNNQCDAFEDKIVYASRETSSASSGNTFNLYLANSNGGNIYPLTGSGENQYPRFSTDGKVILFVKNSNNSSQIGYINLETKQSELFSLSGKKVQSIDW
ncbi:MAG: Tol-Pal system protein TolB [Campylobacterales bacterium]|nr:Tol-Pal system protein TolB [Campylobacterales bacterium]